MYRQTGLGRVWVNPKLLASETLTFGRGKEFEKLERPRPPKGNTNSQTEPDHPVLRYLNKRKVQASDTGTIEKTANEWKKGLESLYNSASSLSYIPAGTCPGPTATQWGQVMEVAKNTTSVQTLIDKLFAGEHAVCKEHDLQWSKLVITGQSNIDNFSKWLKNKIHEWLNNKTNTEKDKELLPQIVARFARLAMDVAREKTQGK
ncbi:MAG TPA: hypothetical protein ENG03_05160 [Thioploca sp.]|nr:hypothetical protein [Thioploca sp.]